jgi:hypothetical protein
MRFFSILLFAIAAAWLATPADAFQQRLYRRAESGDANCLLLCHFDGTDGATTTTDSSSSGHAITLAGDAQLDTAEKQYGTASLLLDGTGDYASIPYSADFAFGAGDYTVEFWIRCASVSGDAYPLTVNDGAGGNAGWGSACFNLYDGRIGVGVHDGSMNWIESGPGFLSTGIWYHLAVCRSGTSVRFFVDGSQVGSTYNIGTNSVTNSSHGVGIGARGAYGPVSAYFNGQIDEVRISNVARYTADFTPAGPFDP